MGDCSEVLFERALLAQQTVPLSSLRWPARSPTRSLSGPVRSRANRKWKCSVCGRDSILITHWVASHSRIFLLRLLEIYFFVLMIYYFWSNLNVLLLKFSFQCWNNFCCSFFTFIAYKLLFKYSINFRCVSSQYCNTLQSVKKGPS